MIFLVELLMILVFIFIAAEVAILAIVVPKMEKLAKLKNKELKSANKKFLRENEELKTEAIKDAFLRKNIELFPLTKMAIDHEMRAALIREKRVDVEKVLELLPKKCQRDYNFNKRFDFDWIVAHKHNPEEKSMLIHEANRMSIGETRVIETDGVDQCAILYKYGDRTYEFMYKKCSINEAKGIQQQTRIEQENFSELFIEKYSKFFTLTDKYEDIALQLVENFPELSVEMIAGNANDYALESFREMVEKLAKRWNEKFDADAKAAEELSLAQEKALAESSKARIDKEKAVFEQRLADEERVRNLEKTAKDRAEFDLETELSKTGNDFD